MLVTRSYIVEEITVTNNSQNMCDENRPIWLTIREPKDFFNNFITVLEILIPKYGYAQF